MVDAVEYMHIAQEHANVWPPVGFVDHHASFCPACCIHRTLVLVTPLLESWPATLQRRCWATGTLSTSSSEWCHGDGHVAGGRWMRGQDGAERL